LTRQRAPRDDIIARVALFVISGVSASGKSTVARLLAERFSLIPVPEFHLVFLDPDAAAIEQRERERDQVAYAPGRWSVGGLQAVLRNETERIGLWLDTTGQSAEQTVDAILANLDASRVRPAPLR
jgi:adenylate kinase family enzyme